MRQLSIIFSFAIYCCMPLAYGNRYRIVDFGAVPDGITLNTKVIQETIDKANADGGGQVVFSAGRFLTGSLQLKSNVELVIEEGAVLLGSSNPYDYVKIERQDDFVSSNALDLSEFGLILAYQVRNIKISGGGTIDGQGLALALNVDSLHHAGILVDKSYNYRRMRPGELARPKLFRFLLSETILVRNLTLTNSSNWGLSFDLCKNVVLEGLSIVNRAYWNNDGVDITDCKNVKINNCNVNAADDGICLKSYHPHMCNDSIYITNCNVRSSASAIKFGTASHGGFKNVVIENIKVADTFRSVIAIESVDGAVIENVKVNNVVAVNTGNAIFIRLGHRSGHKPGIVRNIHISNMEVEIPFGRPDIDYDLRGPEVDFFHNPFPASIVGIEGHRIENVLIENVTLIYPGRATKSMAYIPLSDLGRVPEQIDKYPEFSMFGELPAWAFYVRHTDNLKFYNLKVKLLDVDFRPAFVFDDVTNLQVTKIDIQNGGSHPQFVLKAVENHKIDALKDNITLIK